MLLKPAPPTVAAGILRQQCEASINIPPRKSNHSSPGNQPIPDHPVQKATSSYNHPMPHRLNQLLEQAASPPLTVEESTRFAHYLALLQKWNARTNLTAIRDEEGILSRHFLESILAARALPRDLTTLLDLGSGAGFPGLPIAVLRPEIAVTLAESRHKKAAFLREATRVLNLPNVQVHAARAETLPTRFSCVTLRAVDKMAEALPIAIGLLSPGGRLALLTTTAAQPQLQSQAETAAAFAWHSPIPLPADTTRILLLGDRITIQP